MYEEQENQELHGASDSGGTLCLAKGIEECLAFALIKSAQGGLRA